MPPDPPPPTLSDTQIISACHRLYKYPPYKWQFDAIRDLTDAHQLSKPTNMLVVRPTGGGKSLVYQVTASLIKGVTLFISPLLALASDQSRKLQQKTTDISNVCSIHLDELNSNSIETIAQDISELQEPDTDNIRLSIILFASPQFLVNAKGKPILDTLLNPECSTLHMVVLDEVHIASHFGNSFRSEFRLLKSKLYKKLPSCCKITLFMTGTCTETVLNHFQRMLGVTVNNYHWPTHDEMKHRSVSISLKYSSRTLKEVTELLTPLLKSGTIDNPKKAIIYSNMRNRIVNLGKRLESTLDMDDELYLVDGLVIHGMHSKEEKSAYLNVFMSERNTALGDYRVLLATSGVANAGIDSNQVYSVIRTDFPPSIQDICQEKGRVGRVPSATPDLYSYSIIFDVESFIGLLRRTLSSETKLTDEYRRSMVDEHLEVAKLFCSVGKCFNEAFEKKLANPFVTNVESDVANNPCNVCPGCSGQLNSLFAPILSEGARDILFRAFVKNTTYSIKTLVKYMVTEEVNLDARLFGRRRANANIPKKALKLFIFQIIAWDMIVPTYDDDNNEVVFKAGITNDSPSQFIFQVSSKWDNIR